MSSKYVIVSDLMTENGDENGHYHNAGHIPGKSPWYNYSIILV